MTDSFESRVASLPTLGLGVSTEFGARRHGGLDPGELRARFPHFGGFLEVGADLERGVDEDTRAWVRAGGATTYHFLDVNLEEAEDLGEAWIRGTRELATEIGAAWLCGDAGLWHVGPRDRGHGVLMPPVLVPESADAMGANISRLREETGFEVLPENPPAHVFLGPMHLLEYYARVAERADSGLLLDVAHLAVFQRVRGHEPLDGLGDFPLERVVEMHVAGGRPFEVDGERFVEDDHGVDVLDATWEILEHVLPNAVNLRALCFECERNPIERVLPVFERLAGLWSPSPSD